MGGGRQLRDGRWMVLGQTKRLVEKWAEDRWSCRSRWEGRGRWAWVESLGADSRIHAQSHRHLEWEETETAVGGLRRRRRFLERQRHRRARSQRRVACSGQTWEWTTQPPIS